jgi:hypothetical protein
MWAAAQCTPGSAQASGSSAGAQHAAELVLHDTCGMLLCWHNSFSHDDAEEKSSQCKNAQSNFRIKQFKVTVRPRTPPPTKRRMERSVGWGAPRRSSGGSRMDLFSPFCNLLKGKSAQFAI